MMILRRRSMGFRWDLRRVATAAAVAASFVVSLGPPTAVSPAAITFPAAVTIGVAVAMPIGSFPVTQPAGFAGGGWSNTAMAIARQQFTQGALWGMKYLDTGFRQALRGPPSHVAGDERIDSRALHPVSGGTSAGMGLPGQRIGLELKAFGSGIPQSKEGGLAIGDVKTDLLAGVVSAGN